MSRRFADTDLHTATVNGLDVRWQPLEPKTDYSDFEATIAEHAIFVGRDHHWLGIGVSDEPREVVDHILIDPDVSLVHRIMAELIGVPWSHVVTGPLEVFSHQVQAAKVIPERYLVVSEEALEIARRTDVTIHPLTDPRKRAMLLATLEAPGLTCRN